MENFRLFLHVFAASIWVGGQIVMGALVPTARTLGEDAPADGGQPGVAPGHGPAACCW